MQYHVNQPAVDVEFVAAQQFIIDRGSHHCNAADDILKLNFFPEVSKRRFLLCAGRELSFLGYVRSCGYDIPACGLDVERIRT